MCVHGARAPSSSLGTAALYISSCIRSYTIQSNKLIKLASLEVKSCQELYMDAHTHTRTHLLYYELCEYTSAVVSFGKYNNMVYLSDSE